MIEKLLNNDVLSIGLDSDNKTVEFMEACDWYYSVKMNKDEMKSFIVELQSIESKMI
jgi:hypothetical protein